MPRPQPHDDWPEVQHLEEFLTVAEFFPNSDIDLETFLESSIADWEKRSKCKPWLGTSTTRTRYYDGLLGPHGPGTLLSLATGLMTIEEDSVLNVTVDGDELTYREDYWLWPSNAPFDNEPYTQIKFRRGVVCEPEGLQVESDHWGFLDHVPHAVWEAILMNAASRALSASADEPVTASQAEDGFEEEFDQVGLWIPERRAAEWKKHYRRTLKLYSLKFI